tara:strand:+ start:619 stop:1155 length:537 start_codon:yes stop_codon:yes gene_type:complete
MSTLTVQNIQGSSSSSNTINVASGHVLQAPGHVLQVQSTTVNSMVSQSAGGAGTFYDISGMSVAITPKSASNKILVTYSVNVSNSTTGRNDTMRLLRDSTAIVGTGGANHNATEYFRLDSQWHIRNVNGNYLDSPNTTSATTYKLQWAMEGGVGYLNRRGGSADYSTISSITVMEIAQ